MEAIDTNPKVLTDAQAGQAYVLDLGAVGLEDHIHDYTWLLGVTCLEKAPTNKASMISQRHALPQLRRHYSY